MNARGTALVFLASMYGCFIPEDVIDGAYDRDYDGHLHPLGGGEDCDDTNADIHPDAEEICGDGLDNDCDQDVDDHGIGSLEFWIDLDGDGYGSALHSVWSCSKPEGFVENKNDCDDDNASIRPGSTEACNEIDDDCDDLVDEGLATFDYFEDNDADGFGQTTAVEKCRQPPGFVPIFGDCDDTTAEVNPNQPDPMGDELDSNCDGIDGVDDDGDTWASRDSGGDDCDDGSSEVYPGQFDGVGDGIDNNCDGVDGTDGDGDGWAEVLGGGTDCDDTTAAIHPGAFEIPYDAIDQDCTDGDLVDYDGDGFTASTVFGPDCNDIDFTISPNAFDPFGDGVDANCDGFDGMDTDGDTYVAGSTPGFDCDDNSASVHPDAPEAYLDGIDSDCDGLDGVQIEWTTPVIWVPESTNGLAGDQNRCKVAYQPETGWAIAYETGVSTSRRAHVGFFSTDGARVVDDVEILPGTENTSPSLLAIDDRVLAVSIEPGLSRVSSVFFNLTGDDVTPRVQLYEGVGTITLATATMLESSNQLGFSWTEKEEADLGDGLEEVVGLYTLTASPSLDHMDDVQTLDWDVGKGQRVGLFDNGYGFGAVWMAELTADVNVAYAGHFDASSDPMGATHIITANSDQIRSLSPIANPDGNLALSVRTLLGNTDTYLQFLDSDYTPISSPVVPEAGADWGEVAGNHEVVMYAWSAVEVSVAVYDYDGIALSTPFTPHPASGGEQLRPAIQMAETETGESVGVMCWEAELPGTLGYDIFARMFTLKGD